MSIFKKTIKYSKPLRDLDNKIKNLDEELGQTGVIGEQDDTEVLCVQESSVEKLPKIYDRLEVQKEKETLYNWRESFIVEETNDKPVVIDETYHKTVGRVERYISESNKELIEIRNQVFQEISESTLLNLPEIKCKIEKVLEIYDQIQEGLLNEPPSTKNSDPLTPLDQNFVTIEDLNKHYNLFVNRIQEQIATIGGGGEYRFQYLDGIVGIQTNSASYNGKYLQWNSATNKAEFVTVSSGGSNGISTYASIAGIATYATSAGIATYATSAGIATYATSSGISTYATSAGIATYATSSGIATYATSSGISTYATKAGISTNVIGGIASVTSLSVSGITTLGVVTSVTSINFASGGLLGDPYQDGGFGLKSAGGQYKYATIASNNLQQYLQVDDNIIYIGTGYASTTGNYNWVFKKDGSTEFPNSLILAPGSQSITLQSDQYSQLMWMNADQTVGPNKFTNVDFFVASGYATLDIGYRDGASDQQFKSWLWNIDGLQFPDLTLQTTAFTGYADNAGIATYAASSGIATYASSSGLSTSSTTAGYATTSGISTTSQGLTGTPNISVGVITATDYRIQSVAEKTTLVGLNTANLVYNTGGGNIAICTNPSGDITLNVTGIPTASSFDNYSLAFSVIVTNTGTARSCTAITLNGVSRTIKWFGGSLASAISGVTTSNGYDVYSFTGINTVGSASTTANYIVLGSVNGSYR